MSTDWPFDADQNDPLAKLRIPVVSTPSPMWKYEVALCINDDDLWGPALRPDEAEVRQIVAYIDWRMEYYNAGWKAKMRRRPLDVDSSTNTVTLIKRGDGDWRYQKATWRHGPWPFYDMPERFTLEALLDHITTTATSLTRSGARGRRLARRRSAPAFPLDSLCKCGHSKFSTPPPPPPAAPPPVAPRPASILADSIFRRHPNKMPLALNCENQAAFLQLPDGPAHRLPCRPVLVGQLPLVGQTLMLGVRAVGDLGGDVSRDAHVHQPWSARVEAGMILGHADYRRHQRKHTDTELPPQPPAVVYRPQ